MHKTRFCRVDKISSVVPPRTVLILGTGAAGLPEFLDKSEDAINASSVGF